MGAAPNGPFFTGYTLTFQSQYSGGAWRVPSIHWDINLQDNANGHSGPFDNYVIYPAAQSAHLANQNQSPTVNWVLTNTSSDTSTTAMAASWAVDASISGVGTEGDVATFQIDFLFSPLYSRSNDSTKNLTADLTVSSTYADGCGQTNTVSNTQHIDYGNAY